MPSSDAAIRAAAPAGRTRLLAHPEARAVVAAFVVNGFLFGVWASRVPAFRDRFALGAAELGLVLLFLAGGAICAFPLAGALSERIGPHRTTLWAVMAYGPALALIALAPSLPLFCAALFLFGTLHGGMDVAMNDWAAKAEDAVARPVMTTFHATFSVGAGLGAALGYVATRAGLDPAPLFVLAALAGGTAASIVTAAGARVHRHVPSGVGAPVFALPHGSLVLVGLIAFGVAMGEGAMADWSAVFLHDVLGTTEARAALGYAAFSTTMVAVRLLGDRVRARFGPVRTTRASGLIAAVGVGVVMLAGSLPAALLGFALIGVGYAVVIPLVFLRAARDPKVAPGPAIASVATLTYGGMLLGPVAVGLVAAATSLVAAFGVLLALALLTSALAPLLKPPAR